MTDREKLINLVAYGEWRCAEQLDCHGCSYFGDYVDCKETLIADHLIANGVVIREKGEWDNTGRYTFVDGKKAVRCPKCGCALKEKEYAENVWNFCPVCGADMRR